MSEKKYFKNCDTYQIHIVETKEGTRVSYVYFHKKTRKKLRKSKITFPIGSFDCVKRIPRSFLEWFSVCIKSNLFR